MVGRVTCDESEDDPSACHVSCSIFPGNWVAAAGAELKLHSLKPPLEKHSGEGGAVTLATLKQAK